MLECLPTTFHGGRRDQPLSSLDGGGGGPASLIPCWRQRGASLSHPCWRQRGGQCPSCYASFIFQMRKLLLSGGNVFSLPRVQWEKEKALKLKRHPHETVRHKEFLTHDTFTSQRYNNFKNFIFSFLMN